VDGGTGSGEDRGSCGCEVPGKRVSGGGASSLLGLSLAMLLVRRRARRNDAKSAGPCSFPFAGSGNSARPSTPRRTTSLND
jgi:hypothetical protein